MSKATTTMKAKPVTLGRKAGEKISAVEGIVHSERTLRLINTSDRLGETGEARRARIRAEFAKS